MQVEGTSEIVELEVLGDWAWMRSRLEVKVTPPGGEPMARGLHDDHPAQGFERSMEDCPRRKSARAAGKTR